MKRRDFIVFVDGAAIASPLKYRLDQVGYSEGKNLIFDFRTAEGQLERLPGLAAKSVAMSPDEIEPRFDTETAKAAQDATFACLDVG